MDTFKYGRDLVVYEADIETFEMLKGGRPPKAPAEKATKKRGDKK